MTTNIAPISNSDLQELCRKLMANTEMDPELSKKYKVKRGLRNDDGTGVMAGLTKICNVYGYIVMDGERVPKDGQLIYRGIDVMDIIKGCEEENRFGFEEVIWLLLFGTLPTKAQLKSLCDMLAVCRNLPEEFIEDMIMKAPSPNIMNKLARSVLALYSYDADPENASVSNVLRQSVQLIAQLPTIMVNAYQVKRRHYYHQSMFLHELNPQDSIAESILRSMRADCQYTDEEAKLLDLCLILHAEHGGGNNSSFTTRVLTSSGTDTYSAIAGGIGSLKGPRHGGANIKVMEMLNYMKEGISNWDSDAEIADFLGKIIRKEAGDGSGLIYGMGHAVYTLSDPRAIVLKEKARSMAEARGFADDLKLLEAVERLSPKVLAKVKGEKKIICANVDLYSGLVYKVLGIPEDLFTPLFAASRIPGWCAHRLEEIITCNRIIRPAYKSIAPSLRYTPLAQRQQETSGSQYKPYDEYENL